MRKIMKYCIYLFCCAVISYGLMGCNDGELPEDTGNGGTDEEIPYEPTVEDLQFKAMHQIINNLCSVDSVDGKPVYDFKIGEVLDETMPTELSVGCETLEEAINLFRYSILGTDNEPVDMNGVLDLDLGNYGKLTFSPGGNNGTLATLTVRLEGLPVLTKLYFIPETLWPDNHYSAFQRGDIVYDKTEERMYVCIADYSSGRDGILFTLDGGWNYEGMRENLHIYQSVPTEADFIALYEYYTDSHDDFMWKFLMAFPYYYKRWGWKNNQLNTYMTSSYTYDFEKRFPDLQEYDYYRDAFEKKMKDEGFHVETYVKSQLFGAWHKIWYYGYRLKKGGVYGTKFEWAYRNTFYGDGLQHEDLILSHTQHFGPEVDENRYDDKLE